MTMDIPQGALYVAIEKYSKLGTLEGYLNAYKTSLSLTTHGYIQRACAFNVGATQIAQHKNYAEGLDYLQKAIPPDGKRDGHSNGDLYYNFGLACEGLKDTKEAKKYFNMALEEYGREHSNAKMEATTLKKIGHLHLCDNELEKADECLGLLIDLYSGLKKFDEEIEVQLERASVILALEKAEEAKEIADSCMEKLREAKSARCIANFINLAIIYTQLISYNEAIEASKTALALMERKDDLDNNEIRLLAVLYQTLGAIYNYKGQYDVSIEYHRKATEEFAKVKGRLFQGHCFTNMGYAYSQLKNMEKARECFLHGLQAAKEEGDLKSQWENLEALACVAFDEKRADKAEEYLKEALAIFPKSKKAQDISESNATVAWNRLIKKYRESIEFQVKAKNASGTMSGKSSALQLREGDMYTDSDNGKGVKEIRRGSKVKYLKVRRSGTLRRFNKVALGLEPRMSLTLEQDEEDKGYSGKNSSASDDSSRESGSETGSSKASGEHINGRNEDEKPRRIRPLDSYLPRTLTSQPIVSDDQGSPSEEISVDEESNASEEDTKEMQKQMMQILEPEQQAGTRREVQADVHVQAEETETSEDESDSDSESERPGKPPVPSLSPQPTDFQMRTYETVQGSRSEREPPSFHQKPPRPPSFGGRNTKHDEADGTGGSGIYASIRSKTGKEEDDAHEKVKDSDGNEIVSEEETEKMSRAERDVILHQHFMRDKKKAEGDETSEDLSNADQKKSKSCIVM